MANNELSGPIVSMSLIKYFKSLRKLEKSIRFILFPKLLDQYLLSQKIFQN